MFFSASLYGLNEWSQKKEARGLFTWPALIKELHNTLLRSGPCSVAQPFCRDSKSLTDSNHSHSALITTKNPFMNTLLCLYPVAASHDNQGDPKSSRICPFLHVVAMIKRKQQWKYKLLLKPPGMHNNKPLWAGICLTWPIIFIIIIDESALNLCMLIPLPPLSGMCSFFIFTASV